MSTENLASNWIPDASTFGARLALVRWRMGWNLKEAATECNLTQNSWGNWEGELAKRMPREGWWFPSPYCNKQFPNGDGHILMKSASDAVARAIRHAGITDSRITGHSLRHLFATQLLREGVPIRVVQEALGHASLATTQLYTEVTEDELHDGVDRLPAIAFRARSGRGRLAA